MEIRCTSFVAAAFWIAASAHLQSASAQLPKIKIPKPSQSSSQPAQPDAAQPSSNSNAQPAPSHSNNISPGGDIYAKKPPPPDSPLFLADTLEIRSDTQDYFWKVPKEPNYTSWTPSLRFKVIYAGSTRLRFKAEYFMPDGQPWFSESLEQRGEPNSRTFDVMIVSEQVSDKDQGKAIITPGTFGVKITNLRDNQIAFQGKFKVVKYKPSPNDGYKNSFDFYVDHDWALPIGYADLDWRETVTATPVVRMWFKGGINSGDLEARLYFNGRELATTDNGGDVGSVDSRFPRRAGNDPALKWVLYQFNWQNKIVFIADRKARDYTSNQDKLYINQTPGEYTVKVFYKGEQVRETKFSVADGSYADNGIAKKTQLSTNKIVLPVKVLGAADKWNAAAWKTDGFYGNPLTGFSAP